MAVALAVIAGWLLVIGKGLLLPVFAAVVAVYVLTTAAEALGHQPVIGRLPSAWRHIALSLWTALRGLPGAILAVPMTAMLAIVFNAFPETRFIAILLADRVEPEEETGPENAREGHP